MKHALVPTMAEAFPDWFLTDPLAYIRSKRPQPKPVVIPFVPKIAAKSKKVNQFDGDIYIPKEPSPDWLDEYGPKLPKCQHSWIVRTKPRKCPEPIAREYGPKLNAKRPVWVPVQIQQSEPDYKTVKRKMIAIQKAVAEFYNLTTAEICSAQRAAYIVRPRQIAMYLCKKATGRSLPEIGRRFGGRDHTTVLHAVRQIESMLVSGKITLPPHLAELAQPGGDPP